MADSLLDQRHRGVLSGWVRLPLDFRFGGIGEYATGRPFNITTGLKLDYPKRKVYNKANSGKYRSFHECIII